MVHRPSQTQRAACAAYRSLYSKQKCDISVYKHKPNQY